MAFYSYSNYNHQGDYSNYNVSYPLQDSIADYSIYSSSDYQNFGYDPFPSTISHSISTPADLSYFQYESAPVQFSISYSVAEFDDTDFEEYDPTPYGGGYNLALTYGAALPPSDAICYPRSNAAPPSLPPSALPPAAGKTEAESKPTHSDSAKTENDVVAGDDVVPRGEEGSGSFNYGYGYENGAGRVPYGYGLEAMDICESLFGYWPCISRYRREMRDFEQVGDCGNCRNCGNPWDGTVDYLFGSTNPYEEKKFESDGVDSCMYDGRMHYLHHRADDSWF